MTPAVDSGAVLAQSELPVLPSDTAATLHRRLGESALELLRAHWPDGVVTAWGGASQTGEGSAHRTADFETLRRYEITDPEVRRFWNLLRALTHPSDPGLQVVVDGHEVSASLRIDSGEDSD
jgi:methionyl-tRNA formyltransferase